MPKKARPTPQELLTGLPVKAGFAIEGGMRLIGAEVTDGKDVFEPAMALWIEDASGLIRATAVINPKRAKDNGVGEALDALITGLLDPPTPDMPKSILALPGAAQARTQPQAVLPERIVVNDTKLADATQAIFGPLSVQVTFQAEIPMFDATFASLVTSMGLADEDEEADDEEYEPFAWDMPTALLNPLYAAATTFWRRKPWEYMPNVPPVTLALGKHGPDDQTPMLFASVMGNGGEVYGVALYYSEADLQHALTRGEAMLEDSPLIDEAIATLQQAGAPLGDIPPEMLRDVVGRMLQAEGALPMLDNWDEMENSLVCLYAPQDETDPTYLSWMAEHSLKPPAKAGVPTFLRTLTGEEPRQPDQRETQTLTQALDALCQFFAAQRAVLASQPPVGIPIIFTALVGPEKSAVNVSYTPADELE